MTEVFRGHAEAVPHTEKVTSAEVQQHFAALNELQTGAKSDPHVTFQWWGAKIPKDKWKRLDQIRREDISGKEYQAKIGRAVRLYATIAFRLDCPELVADIKAHRDRVKKELDLDPQHAGIIPHLSVWKFPSPEAAIAAFPKATSEEIPGFLSEDAEKIILGPLHGQTITLDGWDFQTASKMI